MKFLLAILGGFLNRWHGGGFFDAPRWLKNLAWSIPFAATAYGHPLIMLTAIAASCAGIATGHGDAQDLGTWQGETRPDKLEYLILKLQPHISPYWYDCLLLAICALAMVSGGIIGCACMHNYYGVLALILAATLSPISYIIGWWVHPHQDGAGIFFFNKATQIGEAGTGALLYLGLALAIGG